MCACRWGCGDGGGGTSRKGFQNGSYAIPQEIRFKSLLSPVTSVLIHRDCTSFNDID